MRGLAWSGALLDDSGARVLLGRLELVDRQAKREVRVLLWRPFGPAAITQCSGGISDMGNLDRLDSNQGPGALTPIRTGRAVSVCQRNMGLPRMVDRQAKSAKPCIVVDRTLLVMFRCMNALSKMMDWLPRSSSRWAT